MNTFKDRTNEEIIAILNGTIRIERRKEPRPTAFQAYFNDTRAWSALRHRGSILGGF